MGWVFVWTQFLSQYSLKHQCEILVLAKWILLFLSSILTWYFYFYLHCCSCMCTFTRVTKWSTSSTTVVWTWGFLYLKTWWWVNFLTFAHTQAVNVLLLFLSSTLHNRLTSETMCSVTGQRFSFCLKRMTKHECAKWWRTVLFSGNAVPTGIWDCYILRVFVYFVSYRVALCPECYKSILGP